MFGVQKSRVIHGVLSVFLLFSMYYRSSWYDTVVSCTLYPAVRLQAYVVQPLKNAAYNLHHLWNAHAQLQELRRERDDLRAEYTALLATSAYYDSVRELIAFQRRYKNKEAQLAQVIFRTTDHNHSLLVNKGSLHGIERDMVAVYKNIIVGRVVQVFPLYSKIMLITDSACKVAAHTPKRSVLGLYTGCGNIKRAFLNGVSPLDTVSPGEYVLTTGEGLIFPRGFALGRVATVTKHAGLYQKIALEPLINLTTIQYCYLLKKGQYDTAT